MKQRNENHSEYIKSLLLMADFTPLEQKKNHGIS